METTAKFVKEIKVKDPDTKGVIHLSVYKHQNGGMFAIDSSFIDQVVEDDPIYDPFATIGFPEKLHLIEE
jgi:hypothetical protein